MIVSANNEIHITLKKLMKQKSLRDGTDFTIYQLAKALDMPHSILVRLMHADPKKRVYNPRIETLTKIVDFFRTDGFKITLDELLEGFSDTRHVDVSSQAIGAFIYEKTVPVYSINTEDSIQRGVVNIKLTENLDKIIGFVSDEDIEPIFKKGSIFIVSTDTKPVDNTLVAVKIDGFNKVLIRKIFFGRNKILLKSFNEQDKPLTLFPTMRYHIIGNVIQINAKT